jgi:hypothetical protein
MIEESLFVKCELFDEESLINHTFFQLHNKLILLDSLSAVDLFAYSMGLVVHCCMIHHLDAGNLIPV